MNQGNEFTFYETIFYRLNVPLKDFFDFMHLESPVTRAQSMDVMLRRTAKIKHPILATASVRPELVEG